jgi:hypothetical protein
VELLDTRTRRWNLGASAPPTRCRPIRARRRQRRPCPVAGVESAGLSPDLAGVDQFNERLRNARLYASFSPGQVITDKFLDRSGSALATDRRPDRQLHDGIAGQRGGPSRE